MFLATDFSLGPLGTGRENDMEETFHSGIQIEWAIMLV